MLIGDVGWRNFYHLGDEAMTEMAVDELRARGVDITLVAGDPDHAGAVYDLPAVARIGFDQQRRRSATRQEQVLAHVHTGSGLAADDRALPLLEAVRSSDAVLVAGGGNLNSMFSHHVYERTTVAKVARALGKPYALTSQTIGPLVYPSDEPLLSELVAHARLVAAREPSTAALLHQLGAPSQALVQGMDDAYGLRCSGDDRAAVADLAGGRFVVASFAEKPSTPRIEQRDYHALIGRTVAELADRLDCRVLLVPHGGNPLPGGASRDQVANDAIAAAAGHERVVPTRMLTAKQLVALTEAALLVVGSRYHAGIFAARAAVPTISLAPNLYSSVRMRGAASNVGLDHFVFDLDSWQHGEVVRAAVDLVARRDEVVAHLQDVRRVRAAELDAWWDRLCDVLARPLTEQLPTPAPMAAVPVLAPARACTPWATAALLDATERADRERQLAQWTSSAQQRRVDALRRELEQARAATPAGPAVLPQTSATPLSTRVRRRLRRVGRRLRTLTSAG
nr:polysaccharide pyruvyl transferase family protein [Auraticoccus cholistanensis]